MAGGNEGLDPNEDAAEDPVARHPDSRVSVSAELAASVAGLGQPTLEALGVHQTYCATASIRVKKYSDLLLYMSNKLLVLSFIDYNRLYCDCCIC